MTPLRQTMIDAMQVRGFSVRTHESCNLYGLNWLCTARRARPLLKDSPSFTINV